MRKIISFLRLFALLLTMVLATGILAWFSTDEIAGRAVVLDGDSIRIEPHEIRLYGIDAPEGRQQCHAKTGDSVIACGRNARNFLRDMVRGQHVTCRGNERDKYHRLLAVCKIGDREINAEMVLAGHAVSYGDYEKEERSARQNGLGLWRGEFELPRDWRRNQREEHDSGWLSRLLSW